MGKWDGNYNGTYESSRSLEDDIMEAGLGNFTYPTSDGRGTIRETDSTIDVYYPSDSKRGHSHAWYDGDTNTTGYHG